jgi:predicted PurR-regulated permease PerM
MEKNASRIKFEISTATIVKLILAIFAVWFLYAIRDIVVLFFIVLVIVAAFGPIVDWLSKVMPRVLAVILFSLVFLGVLGGIGYIIVPPIVHQLQLLAINLPTILSKLGPFYQSIQNSIGNYQESLFNISSQLGRLGPGIYSTTVGFVSGIVAFLTILVLVFYILLEQESLNKFIHQTLPFDHKERIFEILRKIGYKMGGWLRSQAILMVIIGVLDGIVLLALGLPYALVLAVWGGLVEVIPYIGPWLGLIPALLVALTISPLKGLLILIAYIVIQQIESTFLAPKIMGKAVGLSPVIIILALLIGAKLMGILGVLIAVPVAAAIAVLIQEWPEIKKMRS